LTERAYGGHLDVVLLVGESKHHSFCGCLATGLGECLDRRATHLREIVRKCAFEGADVVLEQLLNGPDGS
jgi:hypothetical protein